MDSVSSRVLMAAAGGGSPAIWGPTYLRSAIRKIARVETAEQPATVVAVGENALVAQRLSDGTWEPVFLKPTGFNPPVGATINDITSNGVTIVAVGSNGGIFSSTTLAGLAFNASTVAMGQNFTSVTWSPQLGVYAASTSSGQVYLSESGSFWTLVFNGSGGFGPQRLDAITWTGSIFVTGGFPGPFNGYYSTNGTNWEIYSNAPGAGGIPFPPRAFLRTADGNTWAYSGSGNGFFASLAAGHTTWGFATTVFGSGGFVGAVVGPDNANYAISETGKLYNGTSLVSSLNAPFASTVYWSASTGFIAAGTDVGGPVVLEASATDAGPWEVVTPAPAYDQYAIAWDGTRFISIGAGNAVYSTTDGVDWSQVATLPGRTTRPQSSIRGLIWTGTRFIGVGQSREAGSGARFARSTNGVTWTVDDSYTSLDFMTAVAWSGEALAAVGHSGTIATSAFDGVTWTRRTSGTTQLLTSVAFGNSAFVAVGNSGVVLTSDSSGITWTTRSSGTFSNLTGVTFGAGLFVAVGIDTTIYTSPNGVSWTARVPPASDLVLTAVTWTGSQFVAVGASGSVISSTNGVTWVVELPATTPEDTAARISKRRPLDAVSAGARITLAVGLSGSVSKIPRPATPPFPKL